MAAMKLRPQHRPSLIQVGRKITVACSCGDFSVTVDQSLAAETWDGHVWMAVRSMRPRARSLTTVSGDRAVLRLVVEGEEPEPVMVFDDITQWPASTVTDHAPAKGLTGG